MHESNAERRSTTKAEGLTRIQAGGGVRSTKPLLKSAHNNKSAEGPTEFLSPRRGFDLFLTRLAGVPCYALHRLPVFFRPLRGFTRAMHFTHRRLYT